MKYTCEGTVVEGKRLGRTLGYPTANIRTDGPLEAPWGVYAGTIDFGHGAMACVVNVGAHPTLPEGPPTVEAHIPGFSGDLYGCRVTLYLQRFLRPERKFASVEALSAQLAADVADALSRSEGGKPC